MADYKVTDTELTSVADAIRAKGGTSASLAWPNGFVSAVSDISGSAVLESLSVSQNGHYTPSAGINGFSDVVVSVSGGGGSNDNFKIACGDMSGSIFDAEVSTVKAYGFASNSAITGVEMLSVNSIGAYAFYNCSNLTTASFPACTSIGQSAFCNCSNLTTVSFPSCTSIESYAFYNCRNLTTASFPACTSIGQSAFCNCSSLTTANFPACISINNYAFYNCSNLTTASFPSCTSIGVGAFYNCSSLITASFPACTSIGTSAFRNCSNLTTVSFPSCTSIGVGAFSSCSKLESVYLLSSSVVSLSNTNAFQSTPFSLSSYLGHFGSIYVPSSLVDAYKSATYWSVYSDRITAYT